MVLAIFGLVIAIIFKVYPGSVLAVWVSLPIAIVFGIMLKRGSNQLLPMSIISLILIYFAVYVGTYHFPITLAREQSGGGLDDHSAGLLRDRFGVAGMAVCCNRATTSTATNSFWRWLCSLSV